MVTPRFDNLGIYYDSTLPHITGGITKVHFTGLARVHCVGHGKHLPLRPVSRVGVNTGGARWVVALDGHVSVNLICVSRLVYTQGKRYLDNDWTHYK